MSDYSRYDEYKFLVEDTARFTDRRQNASTLYTSINSIFLAALSLIIADLNFVEKYAIFGSIVIIMAGITSCISWLTYIASYKKLIRFRFEVLKEIEQMPEMKESIKIYAREDNFYYNQDNGKGLFTQIEQNLPKIFGAIYLIALIAIFILN